MNSKISFDPKATVAAGVDIEELAAISGPEVSGFREILSSAGACWGADQYGTAFAARYLPTAKDAGIGVVERINQLTQAAVNLIETAELQAQTEAAAVEAARKLA